MRIIKLAIENGSRVLFICDMQVLVDQTSKRFTANGIEHGVLMGESSKRLWSDVIIASAQTLEARGFDFAIFGSGGFLENYTSEEFDLIFYDECDVIRKKIVKEIIKRNIRLIGMSATPFAEALGDIYEVVVNVETTNNLIKDEWLCPLKVVGARKASIDLKNMPLASNGEYKTEEVSKRVIRITGDVVPEWERNTMSFFGRPMPTIVFCPSVIDCEAMAEKFQKAGHDFRSITYNHTGEENREAIQRFREGKHIGLVSCIALTRGFDVASATILVDAYPVRKSFARVIQKLGRVMRTAAGKDFALVIDPAGNWIGFMDQIHQFYENGVSELRSGKFNKVTRAKEKKTKDKECKECGYIFPKRQPGESYPVECPSCGASIKRPRGLLETIHGRLDQIDEVDGKGKELPYVGDWWIQICAIASALSPTDDDKARKIALAKYKQIFGKWPKGHYIRTEIPPDPEVEKYCNRLYQKWLIAQRQGKKAQRKREEQYV